MEFFDDDPFENIFEELFGRERRIDRKNQFIRGEKEERTDDFIENKNKIYLIFEFPGYTEKDIIVQVSKNELEIHVKKQNGENIQNYLNKKLREGITIKKELPKFINPKKFSQTIRNGILEIAFNKK